MSDSGYIVEHYTMIHSKWTEKNPVFEQRCSSIRINNSEGSWFSTNRSEEVPSICTDVFQQQNMYLLPKILPATSSTNLTLTTGRQLLITCLEGLPYTPPCPE